MLFKSLVGVDWLACCERVNERGVQNGGAYMWEFW